MKNEIVFIVLFLSTFSYANALIWINEKMMFNCSLFYHEEGDINIGVVSELGCSITSYRERYYRIIAFLMAVDEINTNPTILPNVTLGFTILTHCQSYLWEMRQQRLLQFLPDSGPQYDENYCEDGHSHPVWFDVVATIISSFSDESVSYAYTTALQKIPLFTSAEATSDEFTDKRRFPYFFRTLSADSKQVDFMLHFLRAMNWVYVSVVYTEGPYGENAVKQLNLKAREFGICIEVLHMVPKSIDLVLDTKRYNEIMENLLHHKNARVVIGFFNFGGPDFEKELLRNNATKDFIFLGSDTVYFKFDGVFRVQPVRDEMNETFYSKMSDFFHQRDAKMLSRDPWIREIFADEYNCSWKLSQENNCHTTEPKQPPLPYIFDEEMTNVFRMYDVAYLYAKGIDKTIKNECKSVPPGAKKQLRKCVKANLVPNMKHIENDGMIKIKLDENGDAYARWRIYQNQNGISALVATYDETEDPKLQLFTEKIDWSIFSHFSTQILTVGSHNITTPESVCSKPCKAKKYFIQQELPCCWTCRMCLVNEYIVNGIGCKACPFGQWPDEVAATYCTIIEMTYQNWSSLITLLLTAIIIIGLIFTFYT